MKHKYNNLKRNIFNSPIMTMENSEKETFPERYAAFLDAFGLTPNSLAATLGDTGKVKYHNYKTGESKPNSETLALIATHYPVSTDWLVAGIGSMMRAMPGNDGHTDGTTPPSGGYPTVAVTDEVIGLRQEVAVLKAQNALLERENKRVWKMSLPAPLTKEVEEELNFLKSGSHITAVDVMNNAKERTRIGYEYAKHLKSVDDEVQELIDQTLVIPIDSLDNVMPLWKQVEEKRA